MQRYRSGHNGPDSKSGVLATVPWVRIPPAAPEKKPVIKLISDFFFFYSDPAYSFLSLLPDFSKEGFNFFRIIYD